MKKQTSIAEKQYQELDKIRGRDAKVAIKNRGTSNLAYNNFNFNKFNSSDGEFNELSDGTKYKFLESFLTK